MTPPIPPRRLPVAAVVMRSFVYAWERRAILAAPYAIYAVGSFAIAWLAQNTVSEGGILPYLIQLVQLVFGMAFAIGLQRLVLLNEVRQGFAFFRWDRTLVRYFTVALLLFMTIAGLFLFGFSLAMGPGDAAAVAEGTPSAGSLLGVLMLAVIAVGSTAVARLSLALPAAAVNADSRLALAWQASRGNGFRLLASAVLVLLPFLVAEAFLDRSYFVAVMDAVRDGTDMALVPPPDLLVQVLSALISPLELIVTAIMLSLCYDVLVRGGGPQPPNP